MTPNKTKNVIDRLTFLKVYPAIAPVKSVDAKNDTVGTTTVDDDAATATTAAATGVGVIANGDVGVAIIFDVDVALDVVATVFSISSNSLSTSSSTSSMPTSSSIFSEVAIIGRIAMSPYAGKLNSSESIDNKKTKQTR